MNDRAIAEAAVQATDGMFAVPSWDPYEVWRTRVREPRERSAWQRLQGELAARQPVSLSAGRSPGVRWSPWRRAASPRS